MRLFRPVRIVSFALLLSGLIALPSHALAPRTRPQRFDALVRVSPHAGLPLEGRPAAALPGGGVVRAAWDQFVAEQGGSWNGWFDERSGLPLLASGRGIPWIAGHGNVLPVGAPVTMERLEVLARAFLDAHTTLTGGLSGQLVLDRAASGPLADDVWQVTFRQNVGGVPVEGARYNFHIAHGNLVAFGAAAMAPVRRDVAAHVAVGDARTAMERYLGLAPGEVPDAAAPVLHLLPVDPRGSRAAWDGAAGSGYAHALAWRFTLREDGQPATWVAEVSADDGTILAFYDDTRYERVDGGVFPVSDDGLCPDGCEQDAYPMPFADFKENGGPVQYTGDAGMYTCVNGGASISTQLVGKYIRVSDSCGQANETTTCDNPLDLGSSAGTDCAVPAGHSPGDTHAARSSFYHLNRSMERGRSWLPSNAWLQSQVTDNINIFSTCNAYWNGSVNFYRSGGGCRNTGEIAGVFVHEWGHGIDANDGGGYDNPSEAYADIVALLYTRVSCVGRGFFVGSNCSGYGDACLDCTGIRDQDWNMHASHTPATPAWVQSHCGGGGGACGAEPHCESYIAAEAVYDFAARDLQAAGMDAASAWQLADRLWYTSRNGSGGNAYNCSGSSGNGCASDAWFHKFMLMDDDDGNLANGTPHAAAIYSAFARHGIACGTAGDASNQNSGACPVLAQPQVSVVAGSNANTVSWAPVAGAVRYNVMRNDMGCSYGQTTIGKPAAPATSFIDAPVPNGFTLNYRVQAVGAQEACVGPVSDCVTSAAQPFAGSIALDRAIYGCGGAVTLNVVDGNVPAATLTALVWSDTETTPELVTLTQIAPGAARYTGSIALAAGPAVHGDGKLSISATDIVSATYQDADDGTGAARTTYSTATFDCSGPQVSGIAIQSITDARATVHYTTSEPANTVVDWGTTAALGNTFTSAALTTSHDVLLNQFTRCQDIFFRIRATDALGNASTTDNHGAPFVAHTGQIPGLYYKDSFENGTNGWTFTGEWQIGKPLGKGGSSGAADPVAAYNNQNVLGCDLSGTGVYPGDYEPGSSTAAKSKAISASAWTHTRLIFFRKLNNGINDEASIWIYSPAGRPLWLNGTGTSDADFNYVSFDIPQLDGVASFQIEFRQKADASSQFSGWNIDDMIFKDNTKPDFATCSDCGAAPSFAGATSAADNNACGATGVTVSWDSAASWGSGASGTYAVYRGTAPGFPADAAHRLVKGITGLSYNDTTAPAGTLYYLVRAESDETCASGPNNGGTTDTNAIYVGVSETTSRPAPGAITNLMVGAQARAHARLSWAAPANAAGYNVYRSTAPSGFAPVSSAQAAVYFDDLGALGTPDNYFYLVKAANACGVEGP